MNMYWGEPPPYTEGRPVRLPISFYIEYEKGRCITPTTVHGSSLTSFHRLRHRRLHQRSHQS